jgi:streptogramin lyase
MRAFRHFTPVGLITLAIAASFPAAGMAADALLTGVIKSTAGENLGGVTVSAKVDGSPVTTSVFTDDSGNYYFPPLPEGKYQVWAQALTFATAKSAVDLSGTKHQDFVLKPFDGDFVRQLPGDEVLAALPEDTPDDARMKTMVRKTCTGCHSASFPLQHKFDEAGWIAILDLMKHINVYGMYKGDADKANASIEAHEKELAAYLARARGPGPTSMKFNLRPRPSGEAARVVFKEYEVPVEPDAGLPYKYILNDGSDWSLGTPSLVFGNNNVHDAQQDLDGNIWFTHDRPSRTTTVGRIDAKTAEFKAVKINEPNGFASETHGIVRDAKGTIWFNTRSVAAAGNPFGLAKLDPKTEQITVYVPPAPMSPPQGSLDFDGKGFIWITTDDGALRFDPAAEKFTEFKSNTFKTPHGDATIYGIAGDRDGNGWWLDMKFDHVEHGDIATGKTTEFQLPPEQAAYDHMTPDDKVLYASYLVPDFNTPYPWAQGPRRMGADKHGDVVWIGDSFGGNLAEVDIHSMQTELVPLPNYESMQPYEVVIDKNHDVWTNLWSTDRIAKYDPAAQKWTLFDLPTRGTESRYVSLLERDSGTSVTIPYYRADKVAVMTFRSEQDLAAAEKQVQ